MIQISQFAYTMPSEKYTQILFCQMLEHNTAIWQSAEVDLTGLLVGNIIFFPVRAVNLEYSLILKTDTTSTFDVHQFWPPASPAWQCYMKWTCLVLVKHICQIMTHRRYRGQLKMTRLAMTKRCRLISQKYSASHMHNCISQLHRISIEESWVGRRWGSGAVVVALQVAISSREVWGCKTVAGWVAPLLKGVSSVCLLTNWQDKLPRQLTPPKSCHLPLTHI